MKIAFIITGVLVVLALLFQGWTMYVSNVEEQAYEVEATYGDIEIRHYPPSLMATVETANASANQNFQTLAGYIFGGNEARQQFAMTAPVHTHETDSGSTMSFVLPSNVEEAELPTPNDQAVQLHWSADEYVAVIRFGGFRTPEREAKYTAILVAELETQGIEHTGDFRALGYDPPFKLADRKNEIIVAVAVASLPGK